MTYQTRIIPGSGSTGQANARSLGLPWAGDTITRTGLEACYHTARLNPRADPCWDLSNQFDLESHQPKYRARPRTPIIADQYMTGGLGSFMELPHTWDDFVTAGNGAVTFGGVFMCPNTLAGLISDFRTGSGTKRLQMVRDGNLYRILQYGTANATAIASANANFALGSSLWAFVYAVVSSSFIGIRCLGSNGSDTGLVSGTAVETPGGTEPIRLGRARVASFYADHYQAMSFFYPGAYTDLAWGIARRNEARAYLAANSALTI